MNGRRTGIVLLVALGTLVAAAVAYASIPGQDGTVKFCYAKLGVQGVQPGDARIVDENEGCRFYEHPVPVSQRGPQGPPGPQGVQGPRGATGAQGIQGPPGKDGSDGDENAKPLYFCPAVGAAPKIVYFGKCPAGRAGDTIAAEEYHGSGQ